MLENGKVIAVSSDTVTVQVTRREECSKCGMCGMKKNSSNIDFIAKKEEFNELKNGDIVQIEIEKDFKFTGYILVFLVPLILIGLGLAIGYILKSELYSILLSILLVVVWLPILKLIDKKMSLISGATCTVKSVISTAIQGDEDDGNCN